MNSPNAHAQTPIRNMNCKVSHKIYSASASCLFKSRMRSHTTSKYPKRHGVVSKSSSVARPVHILGVQSWETVSLHALGHSNEWTDRLPFFALEAASSRLQTGMDTRPFALVRSRSIRPVTASCVERSRLATTFLFPLAFQLFKALLLR